MTEILVDVDFGHPPERVWLALTDRAVLSRWFMRTDLEPHAGNRFRLMPDGLLGLAGPLEGELVEVARPRRLVMLVRGEQMHSRVTWELVPLPDGCRLRLSHTGFIGVQGSLRRQELQRTYDRMLHHRLPRALDDLASGKVPDEPAWEPLATVRPPRDRADVPATGTEPSEVPAPGTEPSDAPGPAARPSDVPGLPAGGGRAVDVLLARVAPALRRVDRLLRDRPAAPAARSSVSYPLLALAAAVLTVLAITAASQVGDSFALPPVITGPDDPYPIPTAATTAGTPAPVRQTAGADPVDGGPTPAQGPSGVAGPAAGPVGAVPPPDVPPAAPVPTPAPAPQSAWSATYRTVRVADDGFVGQITVTNTGTAPAAGWSVSVTLPEGATLRTVKRATGTQGGRTVTFAPQNANQRVGPGSSRLVEFEVTGGDATAPSACRVEGGTCSGIPE